MLKSTRSQWLPLFALSLLLAWATSAQAQGTTPGSIEFANLAPGVDAPFYNTNGLPLLGSNFVAALYLAPSNAGPFIQISGLRRFSQAPGYWTPSIETTRLFVAGTRVRVQVRFWDESRFPTNSSFAIAEAAPAIHDLVLVTEHVRGRLARQICYQHRNAAGALPIITLTPTWEQAFGEALIGEGQNRQRAAGEKRGDEQSVKAHV